METPTIVLWNTRTRTKEEFKPLVLGHMGYYSCGPTVYHDAHLGNLRAYVFSDLLKRTFLLAGYSVNHVMNITDVGHLTSDADSGEDKMEKGARREGVSVWDIAQRYTDRFLKDLELLHIIPASTLCKATDHIPEQIAQVQQIIDAGYGYTLSDGIYFDTAKLPSYGDFARLKLSDLQGGARVEVLEGKRSPSDFALWKFSPQGEQRQMEWIFRGERAGTLVTVEMRSSLSAEERETVGFPGWHVECSAMAVKYLGEEFDLHTGGIDHIPVHHTNEIAQATACGHPFARYWLHSEFLVIKDGEKMAKSGENFLTLSSLVEKGYDPLAYRMLCFGTHYRKQLSFSFEALDGAQAAQHKLRRSVSALGSDASEVPSVPRGEFLAALCDDLNMPQALAVVWGVLGDDLLSNSEKRGFLLWADGALGLGLGEVSEDVVPAAVLALASQREEARKLKNWAEADRLRSEILSRGYSVQDTDGGPVVTKSN